MEIIPVSFSIVLSLSIIMVLKSSKKLRSSITWGPEDFIKNELRYTQWLLKILGIWPMIATSATRAERVTSFIIIGVNFFTIAFSIIPCLMFVFLRLRIMKVRFVFFGPMAFHFSNLSKYIFMMYRARIMKSCVEHMRLDWLETTTEEDRLIMWRSASLGRNLTKICAIFMYSGGIFFHVIMTLLKPREVNAFNVTVRAHVLPGYDFFLKTHSSSVYEIIFGIHCLCATCLYTIVTAACNLAAVFVSHACGQVQVIRLKLQRLGNDGDHENSYYTGCQIASIVKSHVKIIEFTKYVKEVLCEICLIEVLHSTLVMCWLEFYCLTEWKNSEGISLVTYFILLISLTFNIFVFCYIGEVLKNQCESLGEMSYMTDWYNIPKRNLLSFVLIISMTRYPCRITAGGLIELSIRSFVYVIKTSLAYFQMLRTAAEQF